MPRKKSRSTGDARLDGMMGADGGGYNLRTVSPESKLAAKLISEDVRKAVEIYDRVMAMNPHKAKENNRTARGRIETMLNAIATHPEFIKRLMEVSGDRPIEFLKMAQGYAPKDINVDVKSTQERIVLVPYAKDWEKTIKEVMTINEDGATDRMDSMGVDYGETTEEGK